MKSIYPNMDLRDIFALEAMKIFLKAYCESGDVNTIEAAVACYAVADAMIDEKHKEQK